MKLYSVYDEKNRTDKCWFSSSNVLYSEFVENANDNLGKLFVTFNNGATYCYKDVDMAHDYLMFKNGGLDGSHGKALNKFIKGKYEFERVEDKNPELINEAYNNEISKKNDISHTFFISGHRNITEDQFDLYYKNEIVNVIETYENAKFVIGDYQGTDIMAQDFLMDVLNYNPENVTVYHMFEKPRNINPKITNLVGGFESDEERDKAMTEHSIDDIAFVSDHLKLSGTAMNILRRKLMK